MSATKEIRRITKAQNNRIMKGWKGGIQGEKMTLLRRPSYQENNTTNGKEKNRIVPSAQVKSFENTKNAL